MAVLAGYLGTTYRRRRIVADLGVVREFIRGRVLELGGGEHPVCPGSVNLDRFASGRDVLHGDAEKIPFDDETFDAVVAVDVFEHLPNPEAALRECARVLRFNGYFVVTVPFMWPVHIDTRAPYYDYTRWTDWQWRAALTANGLNVQVLNPQGGALQVILEGIKALIRRWPRPLRYVGYACYPALDGLMWFDRESAGPPPAHQMFTGGWLIVATKPSLLAHRKDRGTA